MKYVSTRGQMAPASFSDVLLDGLASDGGLVVPAEIPTISAEQRESWRELSYPDLAIEIVSLYATDIPREDLEKIIRAAYSAERFAAPETVPLTKLDARITLVGLSEGPTMAFKDLAMQFLGEVMPYVLQKRDRTLNILGATSGDTGSAAEHAFRGKPNISVFMLSPQGRMSAVQRAQMYSLDDENIHNIAIDGNFDDCQNLVKVINNDAEFKAKHAIGAVNSINFGRICAQIVYYFWAWLRATDALTPEQREATVTTAERETSLISIAVPSGNFGNIFAGHLARQMGLPIHRLILATNENNVLDEFFRTGIYTPRTRENTLVTSSPSMDISKASNLERFVRELFGEDVDAFVESWTQLDSEGTLNLTAFLPRFIEEFGIITDSSTHEDRIETIRSEFEATGVIVDPHTADGLTVARRLNEVEGRILVLETAKPEKFGETIEEALGDETPAPSPELQALLALPQHTVEMTNSADELRDYIVEHAPAAK
ncbi:threonine synthase [Gulosibacter molinativorax]|uniref:Threonine synthase n=1 Tax=Gulosibacter molinativorax TaxID=256821 RepID=A0ABT7CBB8_9MICO|nr:threonine synthase [Gulosibacter molinativorax]MDJ1372104.1 threonine synthase [Gulosibacter molinativorax]QUY62351.1 Threonine synthase [Gulosibacter molinativorax]